MPIGVLFFFFFGVLFVLQQYRRRKKTKTLLWFADMLTLLVSADMTKKTTRYRSARMTTATLAIRKC